VKSVVHELYREALLLDDRLRHLPLPTDRLQGYKWAMVLWHSMRRIERRRRLLDLRVTHAAPNLALLDAHRDRWAVPTREAVQAAWLARQQALDEAREDVPY